MPTFVTAINCMDGRVQTSVTKKLKADYDAEYVDVITEAGPNLIIAQNKENHIIDSLKKCVGVSVHKHGSNLIAVAGHHDCAGNPKAKEEQIEDTKKAIEIIKGWGFNVEIIGLWVNENWETEVI